DETARTVRPLCLTFWGTVWTAGAWCELRRDFRTFRPDRMRSVESGEPFEDETGKDLPAYLAEVRRRMGKEEG
ncbi:MAG: helix-turn-helix transcriptional regulator, partial [Planctomycetota bacterium JB042]